MKEKTAKMEDHLNMKKITNRNVKGNTKRDHGEIKEGLGGGKTGTRGR